MEFSFITKYHFAVLYFFYSPKKTDLWAQNSQRSSTDLTWAFPILISFFVLSAGFQGYGSVSLKEGCKGFSTIRYSPTGYNWCCIIHLCSVDTDIRYISLQLISCYVVKFRNPPHFICQGSVHYLSVMRTLWSRHSYFIHHLHLTDLLQIKYMILFKKLLWINRVL